MTAEQALLQLLAEKQMHIAALQQRLREVEAENRSLKAPAEEK